MENCKKMNKSNNSIHYCLELKDLRLLNPEKEIMDQMDEDDTIIIDTREEQKYWTLNPLINEIEYEINSKGNSEINQNTYSKIES